VHAAHRHDRGNSSGGRVAWHVALRHPDRVAGLILVAAAGYPRTTPLPGGLRFAQSHLGRLERFHRDIRNSELQIFPGLGHLPHEEDPVTTLSPVVQFLSRASGGEPHHGRHIVCDHSSVSNGLSNDNPSFSK
jgi:pimeloyl-ACP methyl ester carboxylesterase